jgi:hypothetical protein
VVRATAHLWRDWQLTGCVAAGHALLSKNWLSRRLFSRIGQNLAQTIPNGEIFTCS